MASGNPATPTDLELRWRPLTTDERGVATYLLDDAWELIQARVPKVKERVDDGSLPTGLVIAVETSMVLRVLRNPEGKRQEAIDDYSWTRDQAVSSGLLYLADEELSLLSPAGATSTAYTIRPGGTATSGYWAAPDLWVSP